MTFFNHVSLAILIVIPTVAFSAAELAEFKENRMAYGAVDAINFILDKIKIAVAALDNGSDCQVVAALIKHALDASKEMDASDWLDKDRIKANTVLMRAKKHAKQCRLVVAKNELAQAVKMFEAIKVRNLKLHVIQ